MRMMMVEELFAGLVVAQDILNEYDTVIISSGVKLTNSHISTLKKLSVDYVFIHEPKKASKLPASKVTSIPNVLAAIEHREKDVFKRSVAFYKQISTDARNGKAVHYNEVLQVVGELVHQFYKHDDVLRLLQRVQVLDEYENNHSVSVCVLSVVMGKWMRLTQQQIYKLAVAAFIADIGKSKVSKALLDKTTELNTFELVQAKRHVDYSKNILYFSGSYDEDVIRAVMEHHERMNGSGYPANISDENISFNARIIAVADTFHALISERPYRPAYSIFEATEILWQLAYEELDPYISERLVKFITAYYVGRKVVLSDGRVGEIILVNPYDRFKPLVKVEKTFVDLASDISCKIVDIEQALS